MDRSGLPCISCDSSDAMTIYEKGDAYCFSCNTFFFKDQVDAGEAPEKPHKESSPNLSLPPSKQPNVPSRGIQGGTLDYYGVGVLVNTSNGEQEGVSFPIYKKGQLSGFKEKQFNSNTYKATGSTRDPDFFGAKQAGEGGKLLIVTEGELDCMAAHQMLIQQGKAYNVVSLPNGANTSAVKKRLEWLESFETIVLNLDNDEPGIKCAKQIGDILSPGKVKIMTLPVKDANDFLMQNKNPKAYLKALWNARPYRPDGVVSLQDTWDAMWATEHSVSIPYPWEGMNQKLYGLRERELVTFTAGTGVGKSAVVRELEHWLLCNTQDNIGILALEESVERTAWGIVSVEACLPLSIREERIGVPKEDIRRWFDNTIGTGRVYTLDHFGSTSVDNLVSKIRYMIKGLECKWIVLDHLSIVVSSLSDMGDERKAIDKIMTQLRQLVEETGAGLILVSHLRRVDGNKGHEQGIEVGLSHLRGSQAIAQLSDAVVALERNQQAVLDKEADLTRVRVLKNRYSGLTGIATHLAYDNATGRLTEIRDIEHYLAPDPQDTGF